MIFVLTAVNILLVFFVFIHHILLKLLVRNLNQLEAQVKDLTAAVTDLLREPV